MRRDAERVPGKREHALLLRAHPVGAIGVQLACKRGEDAKLLDVAADLEQILGA